MKKLIITGYNLDFGGVEKALINLLKKLDKNKYEITLILREKKGVFLKEVPESIKIKEYKLSNIKIKIVRKIINRLHLITHIILNKNKYDVSISYATYDIPFSIITKQIAKKSVLYVHSNYTHIYKEEKDLRHFFDVRCINLFDKIIFISNEAKNDLIKYYKDIKDKSYAINNLYDFDEIKENSKEKIMLKQNKKNLLFVGRLEDESKALFRLMDVMTSLDASYHLTIIGSGPDEEKLHKYKEKNNINNVEFLGSKSNPYPYMKKADLFVLGSYYEGFPVVAIEALTLGTNVVTTINVSAGSFRLKDYVYLCKQDKNDIKKMIEKAIKENKKVKFDYKNFNKEILGCLDKVVGDET
jgi:Glycosyltransferase